MSIGILFKIAAVGILVTLLNQVLKHSGKEEHAYLVSLCGFIIVLTWVLPFIVELFQSMENLFSM
ncbi:MAG: stage III sporulation protein AC [Lachnospiraceae bacterium]|nr:stage III sporulation protein AC [Lachnospiraceae bacterium]